ncbi:hypothetical protein A2778_03940 [Candidatus Daviesbacteria bacterium RIFCSPHIGHO2_01_FULL_40_24]|uniref:Glycosyltransferase RgtA/B/C/D-like domain-containing protein n=1 Tax=Candidatus Daviesbacteria bacterium GW2011_GWC2_40_12 TaxID=1618431 RepID=A0A0G0T674_9BACT|nr:MAG: hypothetical protein UT45_C0002G0045 [Candidatus Daviesbacteria bacterium GW2011_GWA2_39_33]KKR42615.1 MAG: hypothetical protein UT77_C0001G0066 [Candidatus Daviesbacteria bacterium GW2011_GWC2_40_12]OGE21291.1 MAG: hypothetical protein A2778_03940 [Candidatus Daviesbacteria bacterium RIFCSPHIGHO2_01_FULL_40_24]OGE30191.1 MAG: hypothetical protein A3C29_02180 [Candidatus Daviesbacteria bacterium RIFCSPHIGHO2_02_FULL_40_16]OGE43374.1 MAG: hypothetical protein A3A53_01930 [Candidatus Davi
MKRLFKNVQSMVDKRGLILSLILLVSSFLRVWSLDLVPVSLFGDEIDVGYHAYSILKTGKDYSGNFLPIHFESLAEHRTAFFPYSAVPTVALFGISAWGVRLPVAIFGVLGILAFYLLVKEITKNEKLGLLGAVLLGISPWHIHFSRVGFDGPQMLFLFTIGIYFLLTSLRGKNTLWLSAIFLALTPWAYNTAKLFLPLTILAILIIWRNELMKIPRSRLLTAIIVFTIISLPFALSTLFGGGSERFQGISIFNDPTVVPQMGFDRQNDLKVRGSSSFLPSIADKLFHNKLTAYSKIFTDNYFQSFSTQFFFIKGDALNPRQSSGFEFFKIQSIFMIVGLVFLIISQLDKKVKVFIIFWVLAAPIPSALTQGGGDHATRLILMLPVLVIFITFGIYYIYFKVNRKFKIFYILIVLISLLLSFIFYQHDYWVHYPWKSERWWHAGYKEAVTSAVRKGADYERVIISSADEPSLIFFLGWSMYPPEIFQYEYSSYLSKNKNANSTLNLGKYIFPPIGQGINLYEMGSKLPENTLYLATAKEINLNLIKEPGRVPSDILLIDAISYPSGEPAFYLFAKNEKN